MARFIEINDLSGSELDAYVRLTGAQLKRRLNPHQAIFIAESPTVIGVALDAGCIPVSILTDKRLLNTDVRGVIEKTDAMGYDIPVYVGECEVLREITGFELTRGALAEMYRPEQKSLSEILHNAKRIAVLESIMDTTNVGAIFRSAAALGIDAVLITPDCCDPLSRRAIRVSMGTVFMIPWAGICENYNDWPQKGIETLHGYGFKTVAMALRDDSVIPSDNDLKSEERVAIILGTEGTGLRHETIHQADYVVRIPMARGVDSLNVGAAAAIAFYELCR